MAQSDESNANDKIGVLLESLMQRLDQQTPITCHLCKQVFLDTKSLVNHSKSHSYLNGSVNPNSLVQSSAPPENEIQSNSDSSHSSSAPLNTLENIAKENLGSFAQQTVASNPSKLPLGDSLVSPPSKKLAELIFKHQPYLSPLISHSFINNGVSASRSRSNGKQNLIFSSVPKTSAIINSIIMEGSKLPLGDSPVSPSSKKPAELVFKHQPYPSPSISRSAMNHGVSGLRSRSNGKQNISSSAGPKTSAIINSKIMEGSKLRLGDSPVSPPSKKPAELIFKHQPYLSPSLSRSAMNHGTSGSGSSSRSNGKQYFISPSGLKTSAIINSKIMEGSKLPRDDSLVSLLSKKPVELIFRHQPYLSPSISGSAMNHGVSGSRSRSNGKRNFSDLIGPKTSAIIDSKIMEGSKLLRGDSLVSSSSKKAAESIFRHQTYTSPSIYRSAMNYGLLGSHSDGKQNFSSPIWPKTSAIINSNIMERSNFRFPMTQWSFSPPVTVGLSSQSVAGTSGLGCWKHLHTTMKCDVLGHLPLSTKPYINQLERPIEEMTTGGDTDGDELDLTLKLCEF